MTIDSTNCRLLKVLLLTIVFLAVSPQRFRILLVSKKCATKRVEAIPTTNPKKFPMKLLYRYFAILLVLRYFIVSDFTLVKYKWLAKNASVPQLKIEIDY